MRAFPAVILGLALAGAVASGDMTKAAGPQAAAPLKLERSNAGKPMPNATFIDREGKLRRLAEFKGRPTIVNLWATWCAPCKAEMPALDRYAARNRGEVNVVAIAEDLGGWRAVDKFFKPGRFKALTAYLDRPNEFATAYKAAGLPVTVAYSAQGIELWRVSGPVEWDKVASAF